MCFMYYLSTHILYKRAPKVNTNNTAFFMLIIKKCHFAIFLIILLEIVYNP